LLTAQAYQLGLLSSFQLYRFQRTNRKKVYFHHSYGKVQKPFELLTTPQHFSKRLLISCSLEKKP